MTLFQPNLTSRELLKAAVEVLPTLKGDILELGCGSGWISENLMSRYGVQPHRLHLSDISQEALDFVRSSLGANIPCDNIRLGKNAEPWSGQRFDLVINDVAGISDVIAEMSSWYDGVPISAGVDGLDNSRKILSEIQNVLERTGTYIVPLISLSNTSEHKRLLLESFGRVRFSKTVWWPLPDNLARLVENTSDQVINQTGSTLISKYGKTLAFTEVAICDE